MLNIGILGCGRIGQVHARSLMRMPDAKIVALADAFPASAEALAGTTGAQVRDVNTIIASDDVDAIIICTPTDTHYDLIHAAAKAGKAIFCEKPIDMSADRIRDCIKVVQDNDVAFMTAFNRRFDPNFANVQARIAAGEVGDVEIVTILSRDPAAPPISYIESSGGIFRDMMIHDFDMARFLLGEEPVQIFAVGSALVDPAIGAAGDVDTAAVTLTTTSGKICQISNSRRASYGYDQRLEVHGAKGMLRAENLLENTVEVATETGFRRAPTLNFFLERYETAYLSEMQHFINALTNGTPVMPSITDGLKAQLLADAATESFKTGKPVTV
ncbi:MULTISPECIES: inositol 2-dehydrogenase [Pacificibacter]|uniref:inositol 2-dehydrogenase n=1 Tax=Pacificibacter TaxID=1042323 RepID=UPI001C0A1B59|nr:MULTISPECIES: inositol 2-dehydrogenase [Pacificibacter]MBU2936661.1 inositol 2-dehydrogenase [Pacificibacter marinus]MDO6614537.1 inositol 2-dehydrogenase [Pacificibacter sp. 1_MG-2023]